MEKLLKKIEEQQNEKLDNWFYKELLPNGKNISKFNIDELKQYYIGRKQKAIRKETEKETKRIKDIFNSGDLISIKIELEWKKSRMWGMNPTASCWYVFEDKDGNRHSNMVTSGSIGGCGYDKQSTAVAECLNQINELLKQLAIVKNEALTENELIENNQLFGYGSGDGIVPNISGGVGVSCYNAILNKIGFEFKTIASGKTYDVYTIEKINNQNTN